MVDVVVTDETQGSHVTCQAQETGVWTSLVEAWTVWGFAHGLGPVGNVNIYVSYVPDSQAWETDALDVSG